MKLPAFDITPNIESLALEIVECLDRMPALDTDVKFLHLRKNNRIVHPFEDGNGRMGCLWQTVVLHRWNRNFQWIPVETMVYQNQQGYYAALNLSDKQSNANIFIEFMLGILKYTLGNIVESRKAKAVKWGVGTPAKLGIKLGLTQERILVEIHKNPFATAAELSQMLDISQTAVENNLSKLKKLGLLSRIGARKNGYWQILANPQNMEDAKL